MACCRSRLQAPERVGSLAAERPDEQPVVLVRDLAGAVVELELLEGAERAIAALEELQLIAPGSIGLVDDVRGRLGLAQERERHTDDTGDREQGGQNEGDRHRAGMLARASR